MVDGDPAEDSVSLDITLERTYLRSDPYIKWRGTANHFQSHQETGIDVDSHNWENLICKAKFKSLWEDNLSEAQIERKLGRARVEAFYSGKSEG